MTESNPITDDDVEYDTLHEVVHDAASQQASDALNAGSGVDYLRSIGWSEQAVRAALNVALDVWLRIPEGEEESEAEANTYGDANGEYRVEWYLTAVGLVTSVHFATLDEAHAFLTREGFQDYTS